MLTLHYRNKVTEVLASLHLFFLFSVSLMRVSTSAT